jgi:CspA family cold shock protein
VIEGTVEYWNIDEGCGVLSSPEVAGEVWADFNEFADADEMGYPSLHEGDRVLFECEYFPPGQDGYVYRAQKIVPLDGPEGGSGVREPRRPDPAGGTDVIALPASETDETD